MCWSIVERTAHILSIVGLGTCNSLPNTILVFLRTERASAPSAWQITSPHNCVLVLFSVAMGKGKDKRCLEHTNISTCITKKIECQFPSFEYTYPSTLNLNVKMHTANTAGMPS
jgi:hypothetical protein